ncbi:hypothetical protein WOLCODRAFT_27961 [Wolfiporia cocos MD-104 SS10]|uniref:Uncharacterized protein n=1 Tax=Wolfiporia cocos (strain MD-104) TaxID=742152 RepID=A0A2H3IZX5_WOLCO|nr:hypothetical protein WOLCODRAFT_27961 [Wolfiporia cocos MD-104 SS10]
MPSVPKAMKYTEKEIYRAVGTKGMPTWEGEKALPWVIACITGMIRRRPPTIMSKSFTSEEHVF